MNDTKRSSFAMPLVHLSTLPIRINWDSKIPPFSQVFGQIYCLIATGQLKRGDLLPQIRNLAAQLDANPNTIARAYNELEQAGLIRKRQGSGCFVTGIGDGIPPIQQLQGLRGRIEELVADAQAMGIPLPDLIAELRHHASAPVVGGDPKRRRVPVFETSATTKAAIDQTHPARDLWSPVDASID
jgi:GntR family transcriptional regulator